MITIPFQELRPEALRGVIEEFVTRDGTDYGESEIPLDNSFPSVSIFSKLFSTQ